MAWPGLTKPWLGWPGFWLDARASKTLLSVESNGQSLRKAAVYDIHYWVKLSFSSLVTDDTTVGEIYDYLMSLGLVPKSSRQQLYFTHGGRRVAWDDTMQSLELGALSHLHMRVPVPGGADPGGPEAGPSRQSGRSKDPSRMEELLAAEQLDEFGNPEKSRSKRAPAPAKRKRKAKRVNTDSEDNSFEGSDESDSDDSKIEEIIPNDEVAASLPSRTLPKNTERTARTCTKEKDQEKSSPAFHPVDGPSTQKQRRGGKRSPIYYFFEQVDADANGMTEEGASYYKYYLGNREIIYIGASARYDTSTSKTSPKHV
ncbi:hypothetical protein B0H10DRAFT_1949377 [Mycena sp. CBHHK59/15]|nr:hypothetical protein B0H10DRAFT_1949377 [Mycena sp. CBHHK59/15]